MGIGLRKPKFELKTPEQFALMREAGLVVAAALEQVRQAARPGITTLELDAIAEACIRDAGASPSFLGYHGYPASICVSVNSEVVHGIPGPRVLESGDLVSVDCGAIVSGWHGDAAISIPIGEVTPEVHTLSEVTRDALWVGLAAAVAGNTIGDIGAAVQGFVERQNHPYGLVVDYVGHGIGSSMHMPPNVPNIGTAGKGPQIVVGMALAIEPMVTLGSAEVDVLSDDWTVVTEDGLAAAHWEHTVAITADGPVVTTAIDGGIEGFGSVI
ncbi:MAG: type I methionyl aminopeptidase [Candidatus Nanopelagicales bacterium]